MEKSVVLASKVKASMDGNFSRIIKKLIRQRYLFFMLLPSVVLVFLFNYLTLAGWIIAFKDYQIGISIWEVEWTGLEQFKTFFAESGDYVYLLRNTLVMNLSVIVVNLTLALTFAILLNEIRVKWFAKTIQTVSFFPFFISWVIVYAIMHALFSASTGAVNETLMEVGIIQKGINILGDKQFSWLLIICMMAWKYIGYNAIIFISAISSISLEQYESAEIDGAGRFGKIRYITLPNLIPALVVLLIMNIGWVLNSDFELFYLFTNPTNWETMEVLDMYVYKYGLQLGDFSYATAVGMIKSVVSIILVVGANAISKKLTETSII
ncbi:ABC transporter permease subunit [Bacillus sp. P14.5]|uniref:ABC transporter permease n=1 Tax=Bacillus sp. P14.5 TaxID=1983400 RepID=UPI000DEA65C0|nr:ABC transporter permease subunit [Bacillus sp. P14.5]